MTLEEDNPIEEEHENDDLFNLEDDISTLNSSDDIDNNNETEDDSNGSLPQTEDDNDSSLPQTIEDEPNARFEPIQGEYGPYFSNFTEQMLFFWTTKHMIGNLSNAF